MQSCNIQPLYDGPLGTFRMLNVLQLHQLWLLLLVCDFQKNPESPFTNAGVPREGPDGVKPLEAVRCSHATSCPCKMALWAHLRCWMFHNCTSSGSFCLFVISKKARVTLYECWITTRRSRWCRTTGSCHMQSCNILPLYNGPLGTFQVHDVPRLHQLWLLLLVCDFQKNPESPFTNAGVPREGPDGVKPLEAVRCSHATSCPCKMALWAHLRCWMFHDCTSFGYFCLFLAQD